MAKIRTPATRPIKQPSDNKFSDNFAKVQAESLSALADIRRLGNEIKRKLEAVEGIAKQVGMSIEQLASSINIFTEEEVEQLKNVRTDFEEAMTKQESVNQSVAGTKIDKTKTRKSATRGARNKWMPIK